MVFRSHCTWIISHIMLSTSSLLNMSCHICIMPVSLSDLPVCCFCTMFNILKTRVEIKMSMTHTAVRFSSQSGLLGDRIMSSSDTSIPHLPCTKGNSFLCIPTHSATLGKSLNLFVPEFLHLSKAYINEHLFHRVGVNIKRENGHKRAL